MGKKDLYKKSQMEMSFRENTGIISEKRATAKRFKPERKAEQRGTAKIENEEIEEEGMNIFIWS